MSVNQANPDEIEVACASLIYDAGHWTPLQLEVF